MKKIPVVFLLSIFFSTLLNAQTWTGAANTNWNNAGNWTSPASVPMASGDVFIPGSVASNRWPVLNGNIIIKSLSTSPGSQLNVNGFKINLATSGAYNTLYGGTINNSNAATDIEIEISTGSGGYVTYIRNVTFNDNVIFSLSGNNLFTESDDGTGNIFNGNTTYNVNSGLPVRLSHNGLSKYKGNISVIRTEAGNTDLFVGGGSVSGNLSYVNNTAGDTRFGSSTLKTLIGGKIDIAANYTTPNSFQLYRLDNKTTGGVINVQGSKGFDIQNDTMKLFSLSINGYRGSAYAFLSNNLITATINISDDPSYGGGFVTYLQNNTITGSFTITTKGTNRLFEADQPNTANTYNGNAFFNAQGGGGIYLSHSDVSVHNGNLTITRTADGLTQAFAAGGNVKGNFTYTNLVNGASVFGNNVTRTFITGTINVNVKNTNPDSYSMYRVINKTNGGSVSLQHTRGFDIRNDSLLITSFSCQNYTGSGYAYLLNNTLTGNINVADEATYGGGFYLDIRSNVFTGNASFTHNGNNRIYEAAKPASANVFNGNTTFNMNGSGTLLLSNGTPSQFKGGLNINRNSEGSVEAFKAGATITGNFSYNFLASGNTALGSLLSPTVINGTVNVAVKQPSPGSFSMYRLINKTTGGSVTIDSTRGFDLRNDTLLLASLNCLHYYSSGYAYLLNNDITAQVTVTDDVSYGGGFSLELKNNRFSGNSTFTHKGTNNVFESNGAGASNVYNGNTSFIMQGQGALYLCHVAPSQFNGNLSVTRNTTAGLTQIFNGGATVTGNFVFSNNIGGNCLLGNLDQTSTIAGQVNININHPVSPAIVQVYRFKNQTPGGLVNIVATAGFDLRKDTLVANSISLTGYRGSAYAYFFNNQLTANVTIDDDGGYSGGYNTTLRENVITGNTSITLNGSNVLYESDGGLNGNKYVGNLSFTKNGVGAINVGVTQISEVTQNFSVTGTSGINIGNLKFTGSTNSTVSSGGAIQLTIANLFMNKTGGGNITLNNNVYVRTGASFTSGYIVSSIDKEMVFLDNATQTGASNSTHVTGPVVKAGNDAFIFPIGNGQALQTAAISTPGNAGDRFRAQYFASSPHPTYDTSKHEASLNNVSGTQYWIIDRLAGNSNVTVTLEYGKPRGILITGTQANYRVARWTGSTWQNLGNGGTTGTLTEGTVITAQVVSNFSPFTIAATSGINPMSNTAAGLPSPACANTTLNIPFVTSGVFNPGNVFTAQLSNASGSFANPVNIGTLNLAPDGLNVASGLDAFLPSSAITTGTGYRVRITSSNPVNFGTANGASLSINSLYIGPDTTVLLNCQGNSANLLSLYNTTGLSASWNTANPSVVSSGNYRLAVQNGIGCRDTAFATVALEIATWTGSVSSDWHTAQNWSISKVPAAKTHVIVPSGTPNACIISTANATAASLQVKSGAVFNAIANRKLLITGNCVVLPSK